MNIEENKLQEENQSEKIGFLCGISLNDLSAYRYQLKHFVIFQKEIIDFWKQMYRARKELYNSF